MDLSLKREQSAFKAVFESMKSMAQLFAGIGVFATSTEIGALMNNLVIGARRLERRLEDLVSRQEKTLLNKTPFDIKEAKMVMNDLEFQVGEALNVDISYNSADETKDWMEEIVTENNSPAFALSDINEEFEHVRWYLMKNIRTNYKKFKTITEGIKQHLADIESFLNKTESDMKMSGHIYNIMMYNYRKTEWGLEKASLIHSAKRAIQKGKEKGFDDEYILNNELDSLQASYMNGNPSKHLKRLYNSFLQQKESPIDIIVEYRDLLNEDDISNYFTFMFSFKTLNAHIKTLPLLEPLTGENAKLFTSRTAEKYFEVMLPTIVFYVEMDSLTNYGILLMALGDLGLARLENKPYIQMKNYLTEKLPGEDLLQHSDQEMISNTVRNANKVAFCELEQGEIGGTKYKKSQIGNYQDVYWRCFTLLSQGGRLLPTEKKLAAYLKKPHPEVDFDTILNNLEPGHRWYIDFYRSVLLDKTLMF